ncbi:MAG: hemolysin family protein, partial [Rectinema sp.]|nr:hemolysin family protein [Rectinema sp.]
MVSELLVLLFLILLNGFFSLSEMALVSSRKARLRAEADKGKRAYGMAFQASESPGRYLSTIQVSITLIGILTGAVSGATISQRLSAWLSTVPFLAAHAESIAVGLVVIIITLVSVVIGELVPKSIALRSPESIAAFSIVPMHVLSLIFSPLVRALSAMTEGIVRLLGFSRKGGPSVTAEEVKILVEQGEESGVFESAEREMVEGVLNLDDRRVTLFMTPRTEVVVLEVDETAARHRELIIESSEFAYLPVVRGDLDHPEGMLPVKRALTMMAEGRFVSITDCMEPPVMIPEHFSGLQALGILK